MLERDILIIGGGPSGLSTALHIARDFPHLADRILILEKSHYPRQKLCAGGLVIDAEVLLQRLGLDVSEVPHVDASRIHFGFEAKGLNIYGWKRHALRIIRRDEFDHWLSRKAENRGVEIRQGVTVKNITPDQDGVTIETEQGNFRAQVVVGADGSNGDTRRCIFPHTSVHTARVLEVLTPSQPSSNATKKVLDANLSLQDATQMEERQSQAYFDFFPVTANIAGYVWDFPTQVHGQMMRCRGIYDTNLLAAAKRPPLKELLAEEMQRSRFNLSDYEIKGHPIRLFSPENSMSVPRVLLVGDAAGADPFLGEGISIALGYGALAAREIGEAFAKNKFSFKGYKRRILRSSLGRVLITRWLLTYVIYSFKWRWFQILIWRVLKPIVVLFAWLFVLNWGKRMPSTL